MRRRNITIVALFGLALVASHVVRARRGDSLAPLAGDQRTLHVAAIRPEAAPGAQVPDASVRLAYRDLVPADPAAPVLLLLHGNPGEGADLLGPARSLATRFRVVVPDLPGFGASTPRVPDASLHAQAGYALALLDALHVTRAHVAGFSMGGGTAIELAGLAPDRVASLALLASIGAQEFELLGDYHVNHLVHVLQLAVIEAGLAVVPHFGALDRTPMGASYARTFVASDQRRLRPILAKWSGPTLILHGRVDPLVPIAAAREHHRLVPQSELVVLDAGHLLPWRQREEVVARIQEFVTRAESGRAATRASAEPARVEFAAQPFDARRAGPQGAFGVATFALLVLLASLVSEDLTCIGVGLLVGSRQVGLDLGIGAAAFALFAGDLLLVAAGRWFGPVLLRRTRFGRASRAEEVARGERRLRHVGPIALLASRFVPGSRLPTYLAAGALRMPLAAVALWLAVGALLWAPILVGASASLGSLAFERVAELRHLALPVALAIAAFVYVASQLGPQLLSFRGRRLLLGSLRRKRHFEFWPIWLLYTPLVPWIAWLALRHRSLALVTAVNPAMPAGGLVGESKRDILAALAAAAPELVARTRFLGAGEAPAARAAAVRAFQAEAGLAFPVVLKPDLGERGQGVAVIRRDDEIEPYLAAHPEDVLVQEYVPGREFGLFYVRRPSEPHGRLFSITDKRMIEVTGDGRRTLEALILADERAVCLATVHLARHADSVERIPAAGERVPLVELGTHSRGALFLDGAAIETPELAATIDRLSLAYPGFFFGRYDLRADSVEALQQGRGFRIVELNGLTAEATHIYDPKHGILHAYRVLFAQWRLAFEIAAENRAAGARTASFGEVWALWRRAQSARSQRVRPPCPSLATSSAVK